VPEDNGVIHVKNEEEQSVEEQVSEEEPITPSSE
jgi:hypothetical protein